MRAALIIAGLGIVTVLGWLLLHSQPQKSLPAVPALAPVQLSMSNVPPQGVVTASNVPPDFLTNLVKPESLDEAAWSKFLAYRQVVLSENQPIEFYARIIDEKGQAVEGAKLEISVERLDETIFVASNYLHWDPASAYQKKQFELISNAEGWIKLNDISGKALNLTGLTKDGYLSRYPAGNFAGVYYDFRGNRTPTGDALMTNSWDPDKGYILYLRKE